MNFKLTYATMFNPPAEMHTRFDAALAELNRSLGATHPLYINGEDRVTAKHDTRRSPIDQRRVLGHFSLATVDDVNDAMAAAQAALSRMARDTDGRARPFAQTRCCAHRRTRLRHRRSDVVGSWKEPDGSAGRSAGDSGLFQSLRG